MTKASPFKTRNPILFCLVLAALGTNLGCGGEDGLIYERVKYLAISELGNSQIVYLETGGLYTITMTDDGTYESHTLGRSDLTTGTWSTSTTGVSFLEDGTGTTYSITTTDGILRENTNLTISGFVASISGIFQEMIGTGSGMVELGELADYKVELRNTDFGEHVTLEFGEITEPSTTYESSTIGTGTVNHAGTYSWTFGISTDLELTLIEATAGDPPATMAFTDTDNWFIESLNVTIGVLPYLVYNVDYIGG